MPYGDNSTGKFGNRGLAEDSLPPSQGNSVAEGPTTRRHQVMTTTFFVMTLRTIAGMKGTHQMLAETDN